MNQFRIFSQIIIALLMISIFVSTSCSDKEREEAIPISDVPDKVLAAAQDTLPKRFVEEPLPDGPAKGNRISKKDMAYMRQEYYKLREWNSKGVPLDKTLKRLRINYAKSH